MTNDTFAQLSKVIEHTAPEVGCQWLQQSIQALQNSADPAQDASMFSAMARRQLGSEPLPPGSGAVSVGRYPLPLDGWILGDLGRVVLLLSVAANREDGGARFITAVFRMGDEQERAAIVRGLMLLPDPPALKSLALEVGRTNSVLLYRALANGNPYPASYFTEREFNQVVLKSLFIGVPVDLIVGLRERANAELSRMCEDYVEERLNAFRSVPPDIWLAVGPFASKRGKRQLLTYLDDEAPLHRYYAARGLASHARDNAVVRAAISKRATIESDAKVSEALQAALRGATRTTTSTED